ncbi:hypothetical protein CF327_g1822 [Tilletia walkeri]|nr:hypothetical protein CF327_g1822 [Tilletia walkeri]
MQSGLLYTLLVAALATLAPAPVEGIATTIKTTVCRTSTHSGSRTSTHYAPTHTVKVTRTVRPIATTTKTITAKNTKTITSVVAAISTKTVKGTRTTNTVTTTLTDFTVVVPSTTVIAGTFTPTVTSLSLIPRPVSTIYTTIYDRPTPSPSLYIDYSIPNPTTNPDPYSYNYDYKKRGKASADADERLAKKAKDVFCTPSVKIVTTVRKPATRTSTATKTLQPSKVVVSSTVFATQTVTQFPKGAISTVTKNASKTITAATVTFQTTQTAAPSTTVSQVVQDPSTEVSILHVYEDCRPECARTDFDGFPRLLARQQLTALTQPGGQPFADGASCCIAAYQYTAAVAFFYQKSTKTCQVLRPDDTVTDLNTFCDIDNYSNNVGLLGSASPDNSDFVISLLQCGHSFGAE